MSVLHRHLLERAALCRLGLLVGLGVGLGGLVSPAASFGFPPVNTSPPTITGTAQQGQTLTEGHGSWTNGPFWNYDYQWMRCDSSGASCVSIFSATAQKYVPVAADVGHMLRVHETVSNFSGTSSPAESAATAVVVPPPPANTSAPTITGTAQQGQTLTEVNGAWTNSPTGYAYQWLRCNSAGSSCSPIPGANSQTYVPIAADVGNKLRVHETATNAGGAGSSPESQPTAAVNAAPAAVVRPPAVVISVRSLTVDRHGNALIPVQCPASASGGCSGKITMTMTMTGPKRARTARCARGCRPLGTTNYQARAGQKVRVRVHIASVGRRLLTHRRSVRVTLTATSVLNGQTATVTRSIELKAPARQG